MRTVSLSATSSAAQRLFAIAELLEAIITDLPIRNVFGVRRVCHQWSEAINTTPSLQRKTFALTTKHAVAKYKLEKISIAPNATSEETSPIQLPLPNAIINPLLPTALKHMSNDPPSSSWKHPEASWRSLSLFSPAAHMASISCADNLFGMIGTCYGEQGVTLGDAWGQVEEVLAWDHSGCGPEAEHATFTVFDGERFTCGWAMGEREEDASLIGEGSVSLERMHC